MKKKSEYGKYDWVSYVLLIGAAASLILGWFLDIGVFFLIPLWIFIITDWIFSSWNRKRKGKLFAKECSDISKEATDTLNKLNKLKDEE